MSEHIGKAINPDWRFRKTFSGETAPELRYKGQVGLHYSTKLEEGGKEGMEVIRVIICGT